MATKKTTAKKAVSRKTATKKAANKGSVADSWAEGYRPLIDAACADFGFLVRDHGFADPDVKIAPPSAVITFSRGSDFVRIESEYMGEPFTAVRIREREPFGLAAIMAELDTAHAAEKPMPKGSVLTPDEMQAAVAHQAAFLARHPEILRSDFRR